MSHKRRPTKRLTCTTMLFHINKLLLALSLTTVVVVSGQGQGQGPDGQGPPDSLRLDFAKAGNRKRLLFRFLAFAKFATDQ